MLKRSGDQLEVKVTEVADDYIKYKKKGFENGPDFKMSTSDIFMLTFENGEKNDVLSNRHLIVKKQRKKTLQFCQEAQKFL